ncbi:protein kinase [Roseomonas sp. HJA6]|uniref:non-specific serine/threonine protein kinase n=1 Tax=Roseomonas alba TaxID=2846776 RepID=A0ABS7AII7_9PROT|nr:serine/threonine-protein kinase [Neoroseomonas alba]MBW6400969.1 protein kinase [Neoroseomonas alba]
MLPPELNQKYEVRGTLGAGAMGTVYDAVDRIIERRVAIKVVNRPNESDPEAVEAHARFRREAQAAGRLSHPNIVGVYDYGENASQAWIVMELVEGGSLKGRLDKQERFPIPEIVRIMGEVCAALNYSHQRGVVHRDIKPGNIMMTTDGQVKIADFGIARLENSSMTQVGTLIGTPSYMAPEQFRGEPVDLRADIWAAGVMLYQLLTGEKPFEGGFSAVMHKALNTEPPPPSQLSVTTPRGFDAVIARALAKRPEDRYRSAAEFGEAIRNAVNAPAATEPTGLPGLPGLNDDATMVSARPAGGGPTAPRPMPPAPAPDRKGAPIGLIAGGASAVVAAAAAGWFFLIGPGAGPDPALERQRQEQESRDAAEAATREAAAREQAARDAAAREQAVRDQTAAQQRLAAQREQAARDQAAAEAAARDAAAREAAARDQAAREQAQRDRAAAEAAGREAAAREQAAREQAARDQAAREQAARDQAARDQAARDQAARDQAAREQAERDRIAREQAQRNQVARLDLRAAAQAISVSTPCSLIAWSATDRQLTLSGVVRRSDETAIRQELTRRGVPEDAARLDITPFDGDFCEALDLLRPVLGPAGVAPTVSVVGRLPLQKEELMRLDVTMPDWPAHLYVAYFMHSGEVANLVPSTLQQPSAQMRLGEPQGNFPGWVVDEPYGTDLAVVIASDRPLFATPRPVVEPQAGYLSALAAALRNARANGTRVVVRPVVVETVARR